MPLLETPGHSQTNLGQCLVVLFVGACAGGESRALGFVSPALILGYRQLIHVHLGCSDRKINGFALLTKMLLTTQMYPFP